MLEDLENGQRVKKDGRLTDASRVQDLFGAVATDREEVGVDNLTSTVVDLPSSRMGLDEIDSHP